MEDEFKVCVECKSEFEGEGDKCEMCRNESEEELEEGVDPNER
jgi:hypothetical protein